MKRKKYNSGITLIALIITIIVLLILAGATFSALVGDNGVLTQALNTSKTHTINSKLEMLKAETNGYIAANYVDGTSLEGLFEYLKEKDLIVNDEIEYEDEEQNSMFVQLDNNYVYLHSMLKSLNNSLWKAMPSLFKHVSKMNKKIPISILL